MVVSHTSLERLQSFWPINVFYALMNIDVVSLRGKYTNPNSLYLMAIFTDVHTYPSPGLNGFMFQQHMIFVRSIIQNISHNFQMIIMPLWEYCGPNYSQENLICEGDSYYRSLAQAIMGVLQNVKAGWGRWDFIIRQLRDLKYLAYKSISKQTS